MAVYQVSYVFNNVNTGGYDGFGGYYGQSTDVIVNNGIDVETIFYAFNSNAIYKAEAGLLSPSVTLSYSLSNSDLSSQNIAIEVFTLPSSEQAIVDADTSNNKGSDGISTLADVHHYITDNSITVARNVANTTVSGSIDVTQAIKTAVSSAKGFLAAVPELYVSFAPNALQSGLTFPSGVFVTVSGFVTSGNPTVSGTVADQRVTAGARTTPFSTVAITDPGNPSGAGDEIQITILDAQGNSTGSYGTLSGAGLTNYGGGTYTLSPAASEAALQRELNALVFTAAPQAPGAAPVRLTFELDVQAGNGGATDNQLTTLDIVSAASGVACFCKGSLILTAGGEVPVEGLAIGDTVVTASGERRAIRWIGCRSYSGRPLRANPAVQPVRFRAGSLGDGLPRRDLLVSPEHAMVLDGVLIPARCLLNGSTIFQERGLDRVDYFHVELDSHDVLLAEGAPSESFVDDDSRGVFQNAAVWRRLHPGRRPVPAEFCAPRVEAGSRLEAVRRHLGWVAEGIAQAA